MYQIKEDKMTPENFCYWLQGLFEVGKIDKLDEEQIKIIKDHLQLVFTKVTPGYTTYTDPPPNDTRNPNNTDNPVWVNPFQTYCHADPSPKDPFICYSSVTDSIIDKLGIKACCSSDKPVPPPNNYIREDSNKKEKGGFWNTETNQFEHFSDEEILGNITPGTTC